MRVLKTILIVLIFVCLVTGFFLVFMGSVLVSKKKNTKDVAHRKELRNKMIGYVFLMLALAFGVFQSMITI